MIDFEQRAMDYLSEDPRKRNGVTLTAFLRQLAADVLTEAAAACDECEQSAQATYGVAEGVSANMAARKLRSKAAEFLKSK